MPVQRFMLARDAVLCGLGGHCRGTSPNTPKGRHELLIKSARCLHHHLPPALETSPRLTPVHTGMPWLRLGTLLNLAANPKVVHVPAAWQSGTVAVVGAACLNP